MKIIDFVKNVINKRAARVLWNSEICYRFEDNLRINMWKIKNIVNG